MKVMAELAHVAGLGRPGRTAISSLRAVNRHHGVQDLKELALGRSNAALPPRERTLIHAQLPGEPFPEQASPLPVETEALPNRVCAGQWVIAKEPDSGWVEPDRGNGASLLPVVDRGLVDAQLSRDLLLLQPQVQPALPQVVTERPDLLRVGWIRRFLSSETEMAKRQRRGVHVGSWGTACHERRRLPQQVERYRDRLSGPLRDRIDLVVEVPAVPPDGIGATTAGESSAANWARVVAARDIVKFIKDSKLKKV